MSRYFFQFDGGTPDETGLDCPTLNDARNEAVSRLGSILQHDPGYATAGHWRVDVLDERRRLRLHVIVATVEAARPLNMASFEAHAAA